MYIYTHNIHTYIHVHIYIYIHIRMHVAYGVLFRPRDGRPVPHLEFWREVLFDGLHHVISKGRLERTLGGLTLVDLGLT